MIVQRAYKFIEPIRTLDYTVQGRMLALPTYLPDPMFIVAAELMNNGAFYSSSAGGFLQVMLDRGGRYFPTNWPDSGTEQVPNDPLCQEELFRLALIVARPGGPLFARSEFNPPVSYSHSRGDKLIVDNSGIGGDTTQLVWSLYFQDDDEREINFYSRPPH